MLTLTIPASEQWNEATREFIVLKKEQTITLEHSLVSLSKWESKWQKPFLTEEERTLEETMDYIKCMTITQNVDPNVYIVLCSDVRYMRLINEYIEAPMTATWFSDTKKKKPNKKQITSELIYYWMISLNIPFECQKWHLNRLFTLIKVCSEENQPPKKQSRREILQEYARINAERKKRWNTKG